MAVQLADITNNELSTEEVTKVVTKVKQLVNIVKINVTLAKNVVEIISNVMTSSETAQLAASETYVLLLPVPLLYLKGTSCKYSFYVFFLLLLCFGSELSKQWMNWCRRLNLMDTH